MLLGWLLAPKGSGPLEYRAVCVVALWPPRNLSARSSRMWEPSSSRTWGALQEIFGTHRSRRTTTRSSYWRFNPCHPLTTVTDQLWYYLRGGRTHQHYALVPRDIHIWRSRSIPRTLFHVLRNGKVKVWASQARIRQLH